ncbi:MAG: SDR family oxidoreductase [Pseudomonadota bacterium]
MNRVVLITGGSRGIGAAIAVLAARDGFDVAINYRSRDDDADRVIEEIKAQGRRALKIKGDVGEAEFIPEMFDRCAAELAVPYGFVANAGIVHQGAPLADTAIADIERVVRVNLTAQIICNREAVRRMAKSRGGQGGVILNMSSIAARLHGVGGLVTYAITKGGMDVLIQGLGKDVAGDGIRVIGLRPGLIDTEIHDDIAGRPGRIAELGPSVPIGRAGTADEVAEAAVWLLSDKASYVTSTFFDVAGGR